MGPTVTKIVQDPAALAQLEQYKKDNEAMTKEFEKFSKKLNQKGVECATFQDLEKANKDYADRFVALASQAKPVDLQESGISVGFFGLTSAGKSTMLNKFLGKDHAKTGVGETTMSINKYDGNGYTLWDVPGRNDGVNYMTLNYIAFFKALNKRLILISTTVKEMTTVTALLDALKLKYMIVVNKIDMCKNDKELQAFKKQINDEVVSEKLSSIEKIYFVSARHPKKYPDWLVMISDVLGDVACCLAPPITYDKTETSKESEQNYSDDYDSSDDELDKIEPSLQSQCKDDDDKTSAQKLSHKPSRAPLSNSSLPKTGNGSLKINLGRLKLDGNQKKKQVSSTTLSAAQFIDIWCRFDEKGDGFIDGDSVEELLDQVAVAISANVETIISRTSTLKTLLDRCSEDGIKVGLEEFAELLPINEQFLLRFRKNNPVQSSVDFIRVWNQFDYDRSGYIEANELTEFIQKMMINSDKASKSTSQKLNNDQLEEYSMLVLRLFDSNGDGKLQLDEITKLMPIKVSSVLRRILKRGSATPQDINRLFDYYGQKNNGILEGVGYAGLVYDLLAIHEQDVDFDMLENAKDNIFSDFVANDGQLTKEEFAEFLGSLSE